MNKILRVLSFESRRSAEMQSLIERHGGICTIAPSMREIPLSENEDVFTFGSELFSGQINILVFMTGVGAAGLMEILETRIERSDILNAMSRCVTVVRGPKPASTLNQWNLRIDHRVPEPNTWRELLETLQSQNLIAGKRVAIQEYGKPTTDLYQSLIEGGASLRTVSVYRWALPEDTGPLEVAVRRTISNEFDVIIFTSAQQLHHVLTIAEQLGLRNDWLVAANRCLIGSIGPTATETLIGLGLPPDVQPSHPKMGNLVREVLASGLNLLYHKSDS